MQFPLCKNVDLFMYTKDTIQNNTITKYELDFCIIVGLDEPSCETNDDCMQALPPQLRNVSASRCSVELKRCLGHNERNNIWRAGKHFIHQFLPLGAPSALRPLILGLLKGYREASWNSARILSETENLVQVYSTGEYLESNEVINMEVNSLPGKMFLKINFLIVTKGLNILAWFLFLQIF